MPERIGKINLAVVISLHQSHQKLLGQDLELITEIVMVREHEATSQESKGALASDQLREN